MRPLNGDNNERLTKSQTMILDSLRRRGNKGVTPKELLSDVPFAPRTVRYALRTLLKKRLVKRVPCLSDMRQYVYKIVQEASINN